MNQFYAKNRKEWRNWLLKNHDKESEIWLVYYLKSSGKPFVSYEEAVQEALCFGWIDSIVRKIDKNARGQRFTPRNPKSGWSELNRERARRLVKAKLMTPAGEKLLPKDLEDISFKLPNEIEIELKKDKEVWKNFQKFDDLYKRIRVGYIWSAYKQKRINEYERRLKSFINSTKKNKKIGTIL